MPPPQRKTVLLSLFFFSGAVALVYQVVWLRQLTLIFGATAYASSAVLSTFMGGLALGSWLAGRRADAWTDPPLRTYGRLELAIAAYAVLIPWLMAAAMPVLEIAWRAGAERHFLVFGIVKFAAIALLILPATTLMGATLPVLARAAAPPGSTLGAGVGSLYAANTLGAVVGTVACAFGMLPLLGTRITLLVAVVINAIVAVAALRLARGRETVEPVPSAVPPGDEVSRGRVAAVCWVFAASGFAAMALEVAWTRGLSLVLGSSVYAYASMLTAFLFGLAAGAACAARRIARRPEADPARALAVVLAAAGACTFAASFAVQSMPRLFAEVYFRFEPSPNGWFVAQLVFALLVMFPATFALGWVFPLVLEIVGARQGRVAAAVGRVYAANTAGTIVGAAAGGFLLLPRLGVNATLIAIACSQALLGAAVAWGLTRRRAPVLAGAATALAAGALLLRPSWDVLLMNSGVYMNVQDIDPSRGWEGFSARIRRDNELVYARDGLTATVVVARQPAANNLYLAVNGKTDASSREDLETQVVAGHLPLLIHPGPRDVLVIGLASGITVGAVAAHPVDRIRVVEVEEAIVPAARLFSEFNGNVLEDPRLTLSINDARNELQFNEAAYDVIVSEPSNPWMTVAANLFTEDFFRVAKTRLKPGGIFAQWVQTYSLGPETLRAMLKGFSSEFPYVLVFETLDGVDLLVLGSTAPLELDMDAIETRMSELRVRTDLARVGVRRPLDLVAMLQSGGSALSTILEGARSNTDDNGLIEFAAPKSLYLDSQAANTAMLLSHPEDPMSVLSEVVRGEPSGELLRGALIPLWLGRDQRPKAEKAIKFFQDEALREAAAARLARGG